MSYSATVWPAMIYPGATNPSENGGKAPQPLAPDAVIPAALNPSENGGTAPQPSAPNAEIPPALNPSENGGLAPAPSAVPISLPANNSATSTSYTPPNVNVSAPVFTTYISPQVTQQRIYDYFGIVATAGSFYPPHGYFTKIGPANVATTGALPAYTVGGGGQTLTANANGVFPITDLVTLTGGEILLVKDEAGALAPNNGLYTLMQPGDGSNPWVLERTLDANGPNICTTAVSVLSGALGAGTYWVFVADPATFNLGATDIIWQQAYENAYSNDPPRTGGPPYIALYQGTV